MSQDSASGLFAGQDGGPELGDEGKVLSFDRVTVLDGLGSNAVRFVDDLALAGVTRPFGSPFGSSHYTLEAIVGRLVRSASATLRAAAL
jgi:hypothetical protein